MAQFDVHRNTGRQRETIPFVVVVQSSLYARSGRRVVVPLVRRSTLGNLPESPLNPLFRVDGVDVVLNPLEIVSVAVDSLGECVGSLAASSDDVLRALDELLSRSWD